jgi:anthranilate synthase component 1
MFYYKSDKRQIVGASPEMLVAIDNQKVITFPIAGTAPVTANAEENSVLAKNCKMTKRTSRTCDA